MISNPPGYGAKIAALLLTNPELYAEWCADVRLMANRIISMRDALKEELISLGTPGNWDHITSSIGMFSFTGLNEKQVAQLQKQFHIYMIKNGRISMAGLNTKNIKQFAKAVDHVVKNT
jgi:aspartate aminotransferase